MMLSCSVLVRFELHATRAKQANKPIISLIQNEAKYEVQNMAATIRLIYLAGNSENYSFDLKHFVQ